MDDLRKKGILANVDKPAVILFLLLVSAGWINIYAAVFDPEKHAGLSDLLSLSLNSGKQLLWLSLSSLLIFVILLLDFRVFEQLSYPAYAFTMVTLVAVLLFGREINGARSWFDLGFIRIQPAEFTKIAASLAVAKFIATSRKKVKTLGMMVPLLGIIGLPAGLIVLQGDTGSAMVFTAFFIVFYREGLPHFLTVLGLLVITVFITGLVLSERELPYMALGMCVSASAANLMIDRDFGNVMKLIIALVLALFVLFGVNYFVGNVLKPHQQARIKTLVDPNYDRKKAVIKSINPKSRSVPAGLPAKVF